MSPPNPEQTNWFMEEVHPHESALRAWLHHQHSGLCAHDLNDIVQESYLRLLRARAAGKIGHARSYLFGIARHVALEIHHKRRLFSDIPVNDLPDLPTNEARANVVETVSHNQEVALTVAVIKNLPERCREIVTLRSIHGLSYFEIASRLGLAEDTVRVQMARGVRKCARYLREHGLTDRNSS
jgi:RNA polymerase sigma-70 factor (ECF subfamily)